MATNRIDAVPVRLSTKVTEARQTPNDTFGSRIQNGAAATANVVASGVAVAAPYVPGGGIISAAVSGVGTMASSASSGQSTVTSGVGMSYATGPSVTGTPTTGTATGTAGGVNVGTGVDAQAASMSTVLQQQAAQNMQYLMLQNQMQQESQTFNTLSNVSKVRYDTGKAAIQNIH